MEWLMENFDVRNGILAAHNREGYTLLKLCRIDLRPEEPRQSTKDSQSTDPSILSASQNISAHVAACLRSNNFIIRECGGDMLAVSYSWYMEGPRKSMALMTLNVAVSLTKALVDFSWEIV
jgi:hypothetical protein